jgi:hypothetical protein
VGLEVVLITLLSRRLQKEGEIESKVMNVYDN